MTDAVRKNLLVTGATGKQGGSVISNILASPSADDFEVYAVTRNLESSSAQQLASEPKVKLIKGNLDDPEALFSTAAVPIWGVFSVQVIMGDGQSPETEEKQGSSQRKATPAPATAQVKS